MELSLLPLSLPLPFSGLPRSVTYDQYTLFHLAKSCGVDNEGVLLIPAATKLPRHEMDLIKDTVLDFRTIHRVTSSEGDLQVFSWIKSCEKGQIVEAVEALELLVQHDASQVRTPLFYCVLKRCIVQKDLALGMRVHSLARRSGFDSDTFLANHIIRMYGSHGKLDEAMDVFTKTAAPTTYMWASIISVHAEHQQPLKALKLYQRMHQSGVKPNSYIFVAVLKACAVASDLTSGKGVHAHVLRSAFVSDLFVGNSLVDMYAKCGSLEEARGVFDRLTNRDVVTWTAMIAGYVQHGMGHEALGLYELMQQESSTLPDRVTFVCLLQACASIGALHQGRQFHLQIQERGLEGDLGLANSLVNMYSKCGSLEDALKVFERVRTKNVVTWNSIIAGYAEYGLGEEALSLYARMQHEGKSSADHVTYVSLLQASAIVRSLHQGKQLHAEIKEQGLEADSVISSCLVDMYAKCGALQDARQVFDKLSVRDVMTWTAMISGYTHYGMGQEALTLYASMQDEGTGPTDHTLVCLLKACANMGALGMGKALHRQVQAKGLERNVIVGNSLVDMYAKCGRLVDARRVFDMLPRRDVVTWTALLNGYAEHSNYELAMQCFNEMQQQGVEPNETTFTCLLVACSHEGLVDEGKKCFNMILSDHSISPTIQHYNCMVDLLGRSGDLGAAEDLLQTMPFVNDAVGWTSLLSACKIHGDIARAERCFDLLTSLEPGSATAFVLLGTIYANAGRWDDVYRIESLRKAAGVRKKPGKAYIEVRNKVHEFTVGDERTDISSRSRSINSRLKDDGGHMPHTDLVLRAIPEDEKESALCGHAEKLALAYGLLNTPDGTTLLVTKNLRMCNDCHSSTKIMSRLEMREIIVRDGHRVHCFVDGSCSCGDWH